MSTLKNIVIVGGGTAGWMTAISLLHKWAGSGTKVSLIESPEIGTVGVGEGSTPALKTFFTDLGITESEWMPACNATYKVGISFSNWSTVAGHTDYFHPFFSEYDVGPGESFFTRCGHKRRGVSLTAHPDNHFIAPQLFKQNRGPAAIEPTQIDYGYHFDSSRLALFLKEKSLALGLNYIEAKVSNVTLAANGDIEGIQIDDIKDINADFFVDCSGFYSLLIEKALNSKFISYENSLFNDSAVTIPTEVYADRAPSATISEALSSGWCWQIPLTNRIGYGYVYSSKYLSAEDAEKELRKHIGKSSEGKAAKHLKMRIGRREEHLKNNCVAIGLSQGFIEPLEATALMLVQYSIYKFIRYVETSDTDVDNYNTTINQMFEGVKDYIVTHYKLNDRIDSQYWIDCREKPAISNTLESIITAWDSEQDFDAALSKLSPSLMYKRASWYAIFAGMGRFPEGRKEATTFQLTPSHEKTLSFCQGISTEKFIDHKESILMLPQ